MKVLKEDFFLGLKRVQKQLRDAKSLHEELNNSLSDFQLLRALKIELHSAEEAFREYKISSLLLGEMGEDFLHDKRGKKSGDF